MSNKSLIKIEHNILDVAKEICSLIPNSAISGGLGLKIQEIRTRREPQDIDIYVPFGISFKHLKSKLNDEDERFDGSDNDESAYERTTIKYKGFKVDFFQPLDEDDIHLQLETKIHKDIPLVHFSDIIKMKIEHAFDKRYSRFKHKDDIIFMLSCIC